MIDFVGMFPLIIMWEGKQVYVSVIKRGIIGGAVIVVTFIFWGTITFL